MNSDYSDGEPVSEARVSHLDEVKVSDVNSPMPEAGLSINTMQPAISAHTEGMEYQTAIAQSTDGVSIAEPGMAANDIVQSLKSDDGVAEIQRQKELDLGITAYVSQDLPGFTGIFKKRFYLLSHMIIYI